MPRPPALNLEDLVLLYEDGITSAAQIAREMGCSTQAVYRAKERYGLKVPPSTTTERLALLQRAGWSEDDACWSVAQRG